MRTMTNKFYSKLEKLLKKDSRFLDQEGDLLKNNIVDAAYKADKKLIELLLSKKEFKSKFFSKIKDTLVFNINDFIAYIQDKNFLADSYTKYRNKIGLNIDGKFLNERKEVALVWPFKDCVLEGGMTKEDEKRKEIFFNEILAQDEIDKLFEPKVLTNWKRYTPNGEEKVKELKRDKDGAIRENLIIKGNNLLALHSLKEQFQGKIKLIYIDPPYYFKKERKDDSFAYNVNFKLSTWLTFIKNRLEVARDLLRADGIIFVQMNNEGESYLRSLMDEVFEKENFLNIFSWERSPVAGLGQGGLFAVNVTEKILAYSKEKNKLKIKEDFKFKKPYFIEKLFGYKKIIKDLGRRKLVKEFKSKSNNLPIRIYKHEKYQIQNVDIDNLKFKEIKKVYLDNFKNLFRTFLVQKENKFQHGLIENMTNGFYSVEYTPSRGKSKNQKSILYYLNKELIGFLKETAIKENGIIRKTEKPSDFWTREDISNAARGEGGIRGLDRMKKPEKLLHRILVWTSRPGDIVLDYHLGSGTTCAVAHKIGRQYIGVEQLDYGKNDAVHRLRNVVSGDQTGISKIANWKDGGDFVYCELMKYNEQFIEKIQKAKNTRELLKIWEEMKGKSFLNYNVDIKKIDETINDFKKLFLVKQKRILFTLLNKNQLYVNLSEIEDKDFKISIENKEINRKFYER